MKSMTGFGAGQALVATRESFQALDKHGATLDGWGDGVAVVVELRSVNHRFLEVRVDCQGPLASLTAELELLARRAFCRGRFDVGARMQGLPDGELRFDEGRARAMYGHLERLRDRVAPQQDVPVWMLALVPGVLTQAEVASTEGLRTAMGQAFERARQAHEQMRATEGAAMLLDLRERVRLIREQHSVVEQLREQTIPQHRKRIAQHLHQLTSVASDIDARRIEQELALLAERCDVEEELTRIACHLDQFEHLCGLEEPVGRRLDFLLQELMREVNTVGSKSQNAMISHTVVEIKAQVERLREQVQNVE